MEWISFFVGMGVMFLLMLVVFFLMPGAKRKQAELDIAILHEFWRDNIKTAKESQKHFKSIAEDLREIRLRGER